MAKEKITPDISAKAAERLMVEKLRFMSTNRFFASILLHFKLKETNAIETMAVDAYGNMYYNPKFVVGLIDDDLRFVMCHEVLHVILRHCYRTPEEFKKYDFAKREIWNYAIDAVVNDILMTKEGMKPTKALGGIIRNEQGILRIKIGKKTADIVVSDKPSEMIYFEILKLFKDQMKKIEEIQSQSEARDIFQRTIGSKGFDEHKIGNSEEKESKDNSSSNSSKSSKSSSNSNSSSNGKGNGEIEDQSQISEAEMDALDRKWGSIAASANMEDPTNSRGNGEGWLNRLFKALSRPQLNWRALLRRHIKETIPYDSSYKKPRRRTYSVGVYYPITFYKPHIITVAIDVSGSISDDDLNKFISEVYGITRAYPNVKIRVLFWSTIVDDKNDTVYKPGNLKSVLGVKANTTGGTYISCVEDYLKDHDMKESSVIYLTDGYVEDKPNFQCNRKKRIFIIQKEGNTEILKDYGQLAKLTK